jgi:PAS domain S-box-containing protein
MIDSIITPLLFALLLLSFFYNLKRPSKIKNTFLDAMQLQQYEQTVLLSNDLVGIMKTRDGVILWENAAGQSIFGYKANETVGQSLLLRHKNEESFINFGTAQLLGAGKKSNRSEYQFVRKDGKKIWLDITCVQLKQTPGETLWLYLDITNVKHTLQQLEVLTDELKEAQKISEIGNYSVNLKTGSWRGSDMLGQILGLHVTDSRDFNDWRNLIHKDDLENTLQYFERAIKNNENINCEYRIIKKTDGNTHWLQDKGVFILNTNDEPIKIKGTIQDITARKHAESQQLEILQASQLATLEKNRFVATISHEIRTPLNGILGMAQALLNEDIRLADTKNYAQVILQSGETLLTLLNDILDIATLEKNKLKLQHIEFSVADTLNPIRELFEHNPEGRNIFTEFIEQKVFDRRYLGDSVRIRQMLSNLIHNAIKFSVNGDIQIGCQAIESDNYSDLLEFFVIDKGEGIAADKLKIIFDPFTQIKSTNSNPVSGTGLGLTIVKDLAQLMGGDAGCESTLNVGSRFYFRVRLQVVNQLNTIATVKDELIQPEPRPRFSGRVLVVDDNEINRLVIHTLLLRKGLDLVSAVNGQQAVDFIKSGEHTDLILMDCQMPVLDGYEATKQIRQWESENNRSPIPIVALTAAAFDHDRHHCTSSGMTDYLSKPISITELREVLTRWISTEKKSTDC